jgi:hypothetical protein
MKDALVAAAPLADDLDHTVAGEPMTLLWQAHEWLHDDPLRPAVEAWARRLFASRLRALGWRPSPSDDTNLVQLRAMLLGFLGSTMRDPDVRTEARRLGLAWLGEGKDGKIHPEALARDLVAVALAIVGEDADRPLWDRVHALLAATDDTERRANLLTVLTHARRPELTPTALALALDPVLRSTEVTAPLVGQLQEPALRDATWTWAKAHFDALLALVPKHRYQTQLISAWAVFCDEAHAAELEAFFTPARIAPIEGGPRVLLTTIETVRLCAAQRKAQEPSARAFFGAQSAPR